MGSLVSLCSSTDFVAAAEADRPAKLNADASLKDVDQWLRRHRRAPAASPSRRQRPLPPPPQLALATSAASAVARSGARKLERSPGAGHGRRHCRLMRDLAEASRDADKREIRVFSCEDQLDVWRALIAAPAYSDWARGAFELCVAFGDGYPHEPPTVTFVTPILHPNVDARTGRACHAILGTAWHSEMRALDVIVAVRSLLMAPEPSDALDQSVALRFRDKKNWAEEVKEHVKEHASRSLDELQEAVDADDDDDDDDDDDGSGPVCPLTQARARVPVCAPSGVVYDERALREAWAAAGDLPHDPVMTEAAGETVILDPLMLDFCPVARPEDKRIAQLRIAEADAADAADASDSDDDAAAAITTPAPVEDPLAMWRCYCCERPIMRLEVVACPTCRLATYCSETCCADHAGDHAHFCRPREIAKDDDVVATAEAGLAEAVAALQRGDAPGCRTEVLAALDALAGALPPSAFLSADAFNIPDKIRGLFFDLNNLGAKAEQILGGSDARFESTLAAMGAEVL
ncbi:ubiquitin conjugating enzyme [Aureococcus anophagefferens]|uniref:Ubiquitin conjugating enzyme n=1 Tax=Aureococcus anophagefferens TaxID=44056 RepID=A0ABR1G3Q4_AURAN